MTGSPDRRTIRPNSWVTDSGFRCPALRVAEDPIVRPVRQPVASEPCAPRREHLDRAVVEVDGPAAGARLDTEDHRATGDALNRPDDRHPRALAVQVAPLQSGELTPVHARVRGEMQHRVEPMVARERQELSQFAGVPHPGDDRTTVPSPR